MKLFHSSHIITFIYFFMHTCYKKFPSAYADWL